MKKYKHIYFDLDRTIWDFDGNSVRTLHDIQEKFNLTNINPKDFHAAFNFYNELHWSLFREGKINKNNLRVERFTKTLEKFEIHDADLAKEMALEYVRVGPTKTGLIPFAYEILQELSENYQLYIITNGFIEIQTDKLKNSGVYHFFTKIFTSESTGSSKPNKAIFHYALTAVNAKKNESLMVGDDLVIDILGAKAYGIDQVFYNPGRLQHKKAITFEIESLLELKKILL